MTDENSSSPARPVKRFRFRFSSKAGLIRSGVLIVFLAILFVACACYMIPMPGKSWSGPLPPLTEYESALAESLRADVKMLAGTIEARNVTYYDEYLRAAEYIENRMRSAGLTPARQEFSADGKACFNIIGEVAGANRADEIVVIGAHYDSVFNCPGANDNGSAVAALLMLADRLAGTSPTCTLRFVAFANEEPPYFQTPQMGSLVYAKSCRAKNEKVIAMWALETMGYYSDAAKSQMYPPPFSLFYPSTGNFIGFIGNVGSRKLVRQTVGEFRKTAQFPSEGGAIPGFIQGAGWSDHWSFWQAGYQGVMITDTAPFRYPYYHTLEDTPDKIDYEKLARVVAGLERVARKLYVESNTKLQ